MALANDECPENLMRALLEIRNSGWCNLIDRVCVINALHQFGYEEAACWLERHKQEYDKIIFNDFPRYFAEWLRTHSPLNKESLAQRVARETGLELIED